ncbi:MAG: hypothetical protein ABEI06_02920 [Halobacteriaceae archaeon]
MQTGGCETVRYRPSRNDPNEVVAEISPSIFLDREYSASIARLRVEFDFSVDRYHYWIQWWEPNTNRGFGWHADDTEPEYGPVHLQIEYPDGSTERRTAKYIENGHPYRSFEYHFADIPKKIAEFDWG